MQAWRPLRLSHRAPLGSSHAVITLSTEENLISPCAPVRGLMMPRDGTGRRDMAGVLLTRGESSSLSS